MYGPPRGKREPLGRSRDQSNSTRTQSSNSGTASRGPPSSKQRVASKDSDVGKQTPTTKNGSEESQNKDDLEIAKTGRADLKDQQQNASNNKVGLDNASKQLKDKLKHVTQERDKYKTDLNKANKDLKDVTDKFEKTSKKDKTELGKVKKELTDLKQRFQKVSDDKEKQNTDLNKATKELLDLKHKMKVLHEEKNKQEKDFRLLQTNTKAEREQLESDLKQKVNELKKYQNKLTTVDADCKQREKELNDLKTELMNADAEYKQREKELKTKFMNVDAECKKQMEEFNDLKAVTTKEINELTSANDDLRTRLSSQLGAKLQDNNPNIADLSDPNRPTKLAEQFSGLYDDDWTNSYEVISKTVKSEEDAVAMLLKACVKIYERCIERASKDMDDLGRISAVFNSGSDVRLLKQLKDNRKKIKPDERLQNDILVNMNGIFGPELVTKKYIKDFLHKCLKICWSMAIQDPPVVMDTDIDRKGQTFDNVAYRAYTRSGPRVDFIVWPALYLHQDGNLLSKGVAQGSGSLETLEIEQEFKKSSRKQNRNSVKPQ